MGSDHHHTATWCPKQSLISIWQGSKKGRMSVAGILPSLLPKTDPCRSPKEAWVVHYLEAQIPLLCRRAALERPGKSKTNYSSALQQWPAFRVANGMALNHYWRRISKRCTEPKQDVPRAETSQKYNVFFSALPFRVAT